MRKESAGVRGSVATEGVRSDEVKAGRIYHLCKVHRCVYSWVLYDSITPPRREKLHHLPILALHVPRGRAENNMAVLQYTSNTTV